MGRPFRKEFQVELDKPRTFRLTWKEIGEFEVELAKLRGEPHTSFMKFLLRADAWEVRELLTLLRVGLKHEDASLTEDQLAEMCDLSLVYDFQAKLLELIVDVMPQDVKKNVADMLEKLGNPLGTTSSPSPPGSV